VVFCEVRLPALDTVTDRRCHTKQPITEAARFIRRHLPSAKEALEGASFTISAEMRSKGLGVRRRRIARWTSDDSVDEVIEAARKAWNRLQKER
jgi:hypothetical protein